MLINYRAAEVIAGLSRSTIERLVRAQAFPQPVPVTASRYAFVREEVEAWARDRIRARDETRDPADDPVMLATAGKRGLHALRAASGDRSRAA